MGIEIGHAHDAAFAAAKKAGDILREAHGKPIDIELKGYADFVTKLDRQCEDVIREELSMFDDTIAFMGEETTSSSVDGDRTVIDIPDTCWIVDPIDGTSNYAHGIVAYGVAISLRVNKELVVGVLDEPSLGKTYSAVAGGGANVHIVDTTSPIYTNDRGDGYNLFGMSIPFWQPEYLEDTWKIVTKLFGDFQDGRRTGSACCDLAWVADGNYGAYFARFLKPWDVAACGLIITEAGGTVTDWDGDSSAWLDTGKIIASASPRLHDKMLSLIK